MMFRTKNVITINSQASKVYDAIKNISIWPLIFPPCESVKIESFENNIEIVRITAKTKNKSFSWLSKRIHIDKDNCVEFEQLEPATPLSYMSGAWTVQSIGDCSRVFLTHEFRVKPQVCKFIIGWVAKKFFVEANSKKELRGLKYYCENNKI